MAQFGPEEGPEFFVPYGWKPVEVRSPLKTAARLKRLSFGMRLLSLRPQSNGRQGCARGPASASLPNCEPKGRILIFRIPAVDCARVTGKPEVIRSEERRLDPASIPSRARSQLRGHHPEPRNSEPSWLRQATSVPAGLKPKTRVLVYMHNLFRWTITASVCLIRDRI
jgi:hypothetical protein